MSGPAQQVKVPGAKHKDLSSIPGEEPTPVTLSSDLHRVAHALSYLPDYFSELAELNERKKPTVLIFVNCQKTGKLFVKKIIIYVGKKQAVN